MLYIAICDDVCAEIEYVKKHLNAWAAKESYVITVTGFPSAEAFLFAYEGGTCFDILLLDVQMGGMDGVSLAKKIRAVNKEVQIIFITGYMDYIADGYEVEALHYLLKPVTAEKLAAVLNRAVEKLACNARVLWLSHAGENFRIPLYTIRYIDVWRNYVTIHAEQAYTVKKTLGELEEALGDGFFRVGRSCVVNLAYVRKSTKTEIYLSDGAVIPLPRGLFSALNRALIEKR